MQKKNQLESIKTFNCCALFLIDIEFSTQTLKAFTNSSSKAQSSTHTHQDKSPKHRKIANENKNNTTTKKKQLRSTNAQLLKIAHPFRRKQTNSPNTKKWNHKKPYLNNTSIEKIRKERTRRQRPSGTGATLLAKGRAGAGQGVGLASLAEDVAWPTGDDRLLPALGI